jgi:polar amino acid transport system substrate-binding protein
MTGRRRQLLAMGALAVLLPALAGCGSASNDAEQTAVAAIATQQAVAPTRAPSIASKRCPSPVTASLRPPGTLRMPPGSLMARIRRRGVLKVGVDQNTLFLAYRQPSTTHIEGFEVDLAREIARAILGVPKIDLRAVTTDQRLPVVQSGDVDLVVDAVTIRCDRWRQVDFSTVYLNADQRVLVPSDSTARSLADLAGRRVCASNGSTNLTYLERYRPKVVPVGVDQRTDCLVELQEGRVAAIAVDDTFLLGFKAQDPKTKILGPRYAPQPYGIAINQRYPEFVRFVNGVLEHMRRDGTWKALHRRWFGTTSSPPRPRYSD